MADGLNGLLDKLRKQASESPASQPQSPGAASSVSSIPKQQQYVHEVSSSTVQYPVQAGDAYSYSYQLPYSQSSGNTQTSTYGMASTMSQPNAPVDPNRTANLLGLLKFTQAAPSITPQASLQPIPREAVLSPAPFPASASGAFQQSSMPSPHNRTISAQDLVASLWSRSGTQGPSTNNASEQPTNSYASNLALSDSSALPQTKPAPATPEDLVLQLLNRPKPVQSEPPGPDSQSNQTENDDSAEPAPTIDMPQLTEDSSAFEQGPIPKADEAPAAADDSSTSIPPPAGSPIKIDYPQPLLSTSIPLTTGASPAKPLFTYVNEFDQLHAASPRNKTPKPNHVTNGVKKGGYSTKSIDSVNPVDIPLPFSPSPRTSDATKLDLDKGILQKLKEDLERQELAERRKNVTQENLIPNAAETPETSNSNIQANNAKELKTGLTGHTQQVNVPATAEQSSEERATETAKPESRKPISAVEEDEFDLHGPIKVYNFPMKPFSAITISSQIPGYERPRFPSSKMSEIARMPRQFDQLDRNLIAASSSFIVYAISRSNGRGGIRILRQEDGQDRVLNKDTTDRTFNVVISRGERLLATSISGAVVWADIVEGFERSDWQNHSFVFPPSEEQGQTNGVLKSRARKSSCHIDVFAVGRGKTISIIHAPTAKSYGQGRKGNEVGSKKYLAEHSRIIDTGKASKDFCFSEDDTVIISIDKAGKLKLWDVQDLVTFGGAYASGIPPLPQSPIVLSTPSMVLSAVAAGESYRATSVMFLDKYRPFAKGLALRYVLVGMKQNHTLQLWDLALGRPVQEINFPQSSDTDALCSVAYHPPTGIVVVGNPTRNSIYFVHLSAPKYNLPPQSQAQYIKNLAIKSDAIPKPDATAILSGLREYSFDSKGQLMSLDILDASNTETEDGESQPLFELYVAHSKGMTSLNIYKEDLGWDSECKTKDSVDALEAKLCTIAPMPTPPPAMETSQESQSQTAMPEESKPSFAPEKITRRGSPSPVRTPAVPPPTPPPAASQGLSAAPSAPKQEKIEATPTQPTPTPRKKNKGRQQQQGQQTLVSVAAEGSLSTPLEKLQERSVQERPVGQKAKNALPPISGQQALQSENQNIVTPAYLEQEVKKLEGCVSAEFNKVISSELDKLYKTFADDRRVQDAAANARHEAILKLMSSTLTENVEHVLSDIVMTQIQQHVIPAILNNTTAMIEKKLVETMGRSLSVSVPVELRNALPDMLKRTMTHPEFLAKINDSVGKHLATTLAGTVERELQKFMHSSIYPAFQQLALDTAHKVAADTEVKNNTALAAMERLHQQDIRKIDQLITTHQHDSRKIDQLIGAIQQLSETVAQMSRSQAELVRQVADMARQQTEFQEQVQRAQAEWMQGQSWPEEEEPAPDPPRQPPPPRTAEQIERDEIDALFQSERFEEATIRWLQSKDLQEELFDEVVKRYRYDFMPSLSQLVLLSVSAAVTVNFDNSCHERLNWLEAVLTYLNPRHPEIYEICQRIMAVVVQRLEQSYMRIAERDLNDTALRKIPQLAKKARDLGNLI